MLGPAALGLGGREVGSGVYEVEMYSCCVGPVGAAEMVAPE